MFVPAILPAFAGILLTGCAMEPLPPVERPASAGAPALSGGLSSTVQEQVDKVFANSRALVESVPEPDDPNAFKPAADTYVQFGEKDTNFGSAAVIAYKGINNDGTGRKMFLRFDLSAFTETTINGAYLELTNTMLQDGKANTATALEVSGDWAETELTWNNMSSLTVGNTSLGTARVSSQGAKISIELTGFVKGKIESNQKVFSISIQDLENAAVRTEFSSREGGNPPVLRLLPPGVPLPPVWPPVATDYDYIYVPVVRSSNPNASSGYVNTKTRALESLRNFDLSSEKPQLGIYGGDKTRPDRATGFFYTKKDGDRWWMVDPEGYRVLNIGMVAFSPAGTNAEKAGQRVVYGDNNNWAKAATPHIKDDLGFNGMGAWSNDVLVMRHHKFPYTKLIYFVTDYAHDYGLTWQDSGHESFKDNVLPVFDPEFEVFADSRAASTMAALKDDPYLIGYFTDNELPSTDQHLKNYLAISEDDERGKYSRAVAWEWLRRHHGETATAASISGSDLDDFRDFIYDYYAHVVSAAIKRHDPNHMILGPRIHSTAKTSPGIWRALGRYCDAIALNYYSVWEPNLTAMADWEKWSGKPVIITEWYTKGMDSGLGNTSGAGWVVKTQNDRGIFYEQFVIALVESGSCVGWHWFKYKDNDPSAPASDPSNTNGNKGIINTAFQEYTALTDRMRVTNFNTYRLVDYFINKNGR
jgi:hypothetical protein